MENIREDFYDELPRELKILHKAIERIVRVRENEFVEFYSRALAFLVKLRGKR